MNTWNIETYVIQKVGPAGNWYDYATLNTNPFEIIAIIDDENIKARIEGYFKKDAPWRLIKRVSEETILDGYDHI